MRREHDQQNIFRHEFYEFSHSVPFNVTGWKTPNSAPAVRARGWRFSIACNAPQIIHAQRARGNIDVGATMDNIHNSRSVVLVEQLSYLERVRVRANRFMP